MTESNLNEEDWCHWHHRAEPIGADGGYRTCLECGHHWPTEVAFVADAKAMERELNDTNVRIGDGPVTVNPATLVFCPLCAHDF